MAKLLSSIAIVLLIGTTWSTTKTSYCPPSSKIPSCWCVHGNHYISPATAVLCSGINSTKHLKSIGDNLQGYTIDILDLGNVDIPFLPEGFLSGTSVRNLKISDSSIGNPYNVKEFERFIFNGLEESLEELHVIRTKWPEWYWPNMKNLKKLKMVDFRQSPLDFDYVGRYTFAKMGNGSLQSLRIRFGNVSEIHPQAFCDLKNLSNVNFQNNSLVNMSRTMFPNPALKLTAINLRYNKLDALPGDMFVNMPALKTLDISENNIKTFPETVYAPIWDQLEFFNIVGNPLACDCNLRWLRRKMADPKYTDVSRLLQFAVCSSPPAVAGLKLASLSVDQLIC